ncbi:UNVERIFIED_CONTAM: hypothetical protein PYX00_007873 [Menopon gallinae]|uniref:Zinc finger PHD-type domain-containing protein n=1 Tax=Menopon gallinae TaxID=328185 RepID=A0AAW2HM41_9NEOP
MEISDTLKTDIKDIQSGIIKCIQNHQALALKLKEDPTLETDIKVELTHIQKQIVDLNEKQKILLQQLRKELEDNMTNGQLAAYNFNLYKVKPGQLETKKRRRKDLSLAPKVVSCRATHSPPSLSPSPTPSSSSLSDDSVDYVSPFMLPIPVPKARPKLLPDIKDNAYLGGVNRRDLRPPRLRKNQKILSDEEVFKDIPVYYDPVPSPPPVDEKDLKARFMGALSLIPKEMLNEILNRKVERKRRSTATNNPNFVYNNDWEIPAVSRYNQWKRSKTYLSPHKLSKIENAKKCKIDEYNEVRRREKEAENDKLGRLNFEDMKLPPGLTVEKLEGKSRNSTPDSSTSNAVCFICRSSGLLTVCRECTATYHTSCVSPSSLFCPSCKHKRSSHDEGSSEESSREEFVSKCPNVAESYNKLKKYIEHHTDSDAAALYIERENYKMELIIKNQELYEEKHKLEEKAAELSEALLLQEDSRNELLREEKAILSKIKVIVDFVEVFQKTNPKKVSETTENEEVTDVKEEVEAGEEEEEEEEEKVTVEDEDEKTEEKEEVEREETEVEEKKVKDECEVDENACSSPTGSCHDAEDSPALLSQESVGNSVKNEEGNCESPSSASKGSLFVDAGNAENSTSPRSVVSKDSISNPLFELDEGDEQCTSQSVEKSSAGSDVVEYETPSSEPEFY